MSTGGWCGSSPRERICLADLCSGFVSPSFSPFDLRVRPGREALSPRAVTVTMRFPLSDWIDAHSDCRHNLAESGMAGSIEHPTPTRTEIRDADEGELRIGIAKTLAVDPRRVFLTHGATEANSLAISYVARRVRTRPMQCRVRFPEYPSLFDTARWAGFRLVQASGPVAAAVVSLPRNPEGVLWGRDRFFDWAEGARSVLVDETFREFSGTSSLVREDRPGLWGTGTLTKFFAGDDLRVGFVVAPEALLDDFARFHGLVTDRVPPYSIAGAIATLRARDRLHREVERILGRNRAAWRVAYPGSSPIVGPVYFDREGVGDGDRLARRCLRASVLVCPGSFFGQAPGVRIGLTRRSFPEDLQAYLDVRDRRRAYDSESITGARRNRTARPLREGTGRARGGPK